MVYGDFMSVNSVLKHLKEYNLESHFIKVEESIGTVEEAAKVLGCMPADIAKTMAFMLDEEPIVIVMAGDMIIDNSKYKGYFHKKAKMVPFELVEELTSHIPGGVTPYGLKEDVAIYLDESLKTHDFIYPAAGDPVTAIKLTISEIESSLNDYKWIDVTKKRGE